jgi:hypothetical protein
MMAVVTIVVTNIVAIVLAIITVVLAIVPTTRSLFLLPVIFRCAQHLGAHETCCQNSNWTKIHLFGHLATLSKETSVSALHKCMFFLVFDKTEAEDWKGLRDLLQQLQRCVYLVLFHPHRPVARYSPFRRRFRQGRKLGIYHNSVAPSHMVVMVGSAGFQNTAAAEHSYFASGYAGLGSLFADKGA